MTIDEYDEYKQIHQCDPGHSVYSLGVEPFIQTIQWSDEALARIKSVYKTTDYATGDGTLTVFFEDSTFSCNISNQKWSNRDQRSAEVLG